MIDKTHQVISKIVDIKKELKNSDSEKDEILVKKLYNIIIELEKVEGFLLKIYKEM